MESNLNKFKISLFILLVFLLPQGQNYRLYFLALLLSASVLFFGFKKFSFTGFNILVYSLTSWLIVSTIIRSYFLIDISFKDITEIGRLLLPCILIRDISIFKDFSFTDLIRVMLVVIFVNTIIVYHEYMFAFDSAIYDIAKKYYWGDIHGRVYYRAKGLFPGPGQHAFILVFILIVFLVKYLYSKRHSIFWIAAILVLLASIALTLSRTGVVCSLIAILLTLYISIKKRKYTKIGLLLIPILAGGFYFVTANFDLLFRIINTLQTGLNDSSYSERGNMWSSIAQIAIRRIDFILFGWGKDYFGEAGRYTDNEYVFIFFFYGLIFFTVFFGFIFHFLLKNITRLKKLSIEKSSLFILFLVGLVFAWPSVFFLYTQNLILITIIIAISLTRNSTYGIYRIHR